MGLALLLIVLVVLLLSYRLYVSPKVRQNISPLWERSTPARRKMDSVDYFPTSSSVLTGFQLRSISLDVIISPIIAVQFGWLPAILWLLIGAIFFGWVQDYFSTIISVRSAGKPFTKLFNQYFNSKSRTLIYLFLIAYLLIIISQFSLLLSSLLSRVNIPFAIMIFVLVGFFAGFLIYRTRVSLIITSFLSIVIAIFGIWLSSSTQIMDAIDQINHFLIELGMVGSSGSIFGEITWQSLLSLLVIFFVCYLGATLPAWRFAVPFNYISNWMVIIGFSIALIGFSLGTLTGSINANFELPPVVTTYQPQIGPLWPILFVTLSSGAISGWHSLVSSFTTSHQVEKEPLVKPITTGALYGETFTVAIIIIFAATFGVSSGIFDQEQNYALVSGPASVFATGFAKTWNVIGISPTIGASISTILLTLMGLSVLHLVVRYARVIQSDLLGRRLPAFNNPHLSTITVLIVSLLLVMIGVREWLWILFAGANQLLAALVLMFATIWLAGQKKAILWTFIPSVFLFLTGLTAIFYSSVYQPFLKEIVTSASIYDLITIRSITLLAFAIFFSTIAAYIYIIGLNKLIGARMKNS